MAQTNSLDFSTPTGAEKALSKVAQLMGRAGQPVAATEFNQKPKRSSDTTYREAYLTLVSGQMVTLRVNGTGDIYQVLLNNSAQPLKEHTDTEKAVVEIANLAQKNQAAFQKAQARKAVALPKAMTTPKPKIADALGQQLTELDNQISERKATIAELRSKLGAGAMTDSVDTELPELDSVSREVLEQLAQADGQAVEDGDLISKQGRDGLLELGLIDRYTDKGDNVLNDKGRSVVAMLDAANVRVPTPNLAPDVPTSVAESTQERVLFFASAYVAARELGAATGVVLDSASTDGAKGALQVALDIVETNCPLNLEAGNIEQARHEMRMAASYRAAIAMLDSAAARQMDDAALAQLVAIAKADAASEDEIADQDALATLVALSMVDVAEGIYFVSEPGRQYLNDNGLDAYGEPFVE
ncbi:hypothetical protein ACIPL1_27440 [Pseudomonas sp. NPDC090202]|uniref:defense against restriction DarA-related protein n=1 Tax=Pseudomonas sp. NPDC090202 TaxID=3364476 RepID=UPI0038130976